MTLLVCYVQQVSYAGDVCTGMQHINKVIGSSILQLNEMPFLSPVHSPCGMLFILK